ncbi:MAG: hypothetical protein ACE5FJ_09645, partial [Gemmatimonadales bacterium]
HLLILASKADPASYTLGKRVAAVLAAYLPSSKARIVRAPYLRRVASLISTKQLDVAILSREHATALAKGREPFAEFEPVPLRIIVGLAQYLLVCHQDFRALHAYLVAETLSRHQGELPVPVSPEGSDSAGDDATLSMHPGAHAFFDGRPPPAD